MNKTIIALTTGIFLASGAAAFANSSALDVQGLPERGASQSLLPSFGLVGGDTYEAYSAQNQFGDRSPTFDNDHAGVGVDYTPTAAIDNTVAGDDIYSPQNGWGDHNAY